MIRNQVGAEYSDIFLINQRLHENGYKCMRQSGNVSQLEGGTKPENPNSTHARVSNFLTREKLAKNEEIFQAFSLNQFLSCLYNQHRWGGRGSENERTIIQ